jgi:hypothetical protein
MNTPQPDTIDEVLLKPAQWQLDDYVKAKAALSAIVAEIIGEFEPTTKARPPFVRNSLRAEQRQRAIAKGFTL